MQDITTNLKKFDSKKFSSVQRLVLASKIRVLFSTILITSIAALAWWVVYKYLNIIIIPTGIVSIIVALFVILSPIIIIWLIIDILISRKSNKNFKALGIRYDHLEQNLREINAQMLEDNTYQVSKDVYLTCDWFLDLNTGDAVKISDIKRVFPEYTEYNARVCFSITTDETSKGFIVPSKKEVDETIFLLQQLNLNIDTTNLVCDATIPHSNRVGGYQEME